ncbi:putative quinol monooxygenase [Streptomyces sp. NPDC059443]|uniref:putative quinol monooxygenase n=1 Tax=unclassified Streptomyces TaxID=2593676 RepID=UPI00367D6B9C
MTGPLTGPTTGTVATATPPVTGVPAAALTAAVTLRALPGQEAAVRALALAMVAPTRAEPGNISYGAYEDPATPGAWVILEEWADEPSWRAHLASPHLAHALSHTASLLAGPPVERVFRA